MPFTLVFWYSSTRSPRLTRCVFIVLGLGAPGVVFLVETGLAYVMLGETKVGEIEHGSFCDGIKGACNVLLRECRWWRV
jgi:hypothetical protein